MREAPPRAALKFDTQAIRGRGDEGYSDGARRTRRSPLISARQRREHTLGEAVEVWRGSVATWECDAMGHLNVGFYVAKSMEGVIGLAAELGMAGAFAADARATLIVREQHIRFLREARPGAPLMMTGGVVEIGESDARLL